MLFNGMQKASHYVQFIKSVKKNEVCGNDSTHTSPCVPPLGINFVFLCTNIVFLCNNRFKALFYKIIVQAFLIEGLCYKL